MANPPTLQDPVQAGREVRAQILPPPPILTVSEWADRERVLGPEETSEPGRWKTDRVPYLKGPMNAVCNPLVHTVVFKGSARIGKTELINNVVGYFIDQDPSPMLLVYPSEGKAKDYSKEKFSPMQRNTPCLRAKVSEAKTRDSDNTLLFKTFDGGSLAMVGTNTPNGLDSRTVRIVIFDELDKCAKSAKNLGDPRALAKNRTITYQGRFKHLFLSTPSEKGDSPITEEYESTNMQRLYLPCFHCEVFDVLEFKNLKWEEGNPKAAVYVCPRCGAIVSDAEKLDMLTRHEWRAEKPDADPGSVGYWMNALYSPWLTFGTVASTFVERKNAGPESLKVFINEWLGETWDPNAGSASKAEGLLGRARASGYLSGVVPAGVGLLTAGVDVQDDRLEIVVRGTGAGRKQWTICHQVISGNMVGPDPWDRVRDLLLQDWPRQDGGAPMRIRMACLDTGGKSHGARAWAFTRRPELAGLIVPVRGNKVAQVVPAIQSKKRSRLWLLDTRMIKDEIYSSLRIDTPEFAGYQAFPSDLEAGYFQQLLAERKNRKTKLYEVFPAGARNEVLDCHVYADGALAIYAPKDLAGMAQRAAAPGPGSPRPDVVLPASVEPLVSALKAAATAARAARRKDPTGPPDPTPQEPAAQPAIRRILAKPTEPPTAPAPAIRRIISGPRSW